MSTRQPKAPTLLAFALLFSGQIASAQFLKGDEDGIDKSEVVLLDPALWLDATDPARSTIIGYQGGALGVYGLPGDRIQSFPLQTGSFQVDVRYGFRLPGQPGDIASLAGGPERSLRFYQVNPQSRQLELLDTAASSLTQNVLASCLYVSPKSNNHYVFALSEGGAVSQLRLQVNQGRLDLRRVRTFNVGAEATTCVADDELGFAYIAAGRSIFKYSAEPSGDDASRTDIAGQAMAANVAGLSLYYASDGTGYLLASQGSNEIAVYQREDTNAFVTNLMVGNEFTAGNPATLTGIDVANHPLGSSFPMGVLVAQDQNQLRLIPWDQLANSVNPHLTIDPFRGPGKPHDEQQSEANSIERNSQADKSQGRAAAGAPEPGALSVGLPAPTAASLAKYGDIPVSLYTGTPNIAIPLYELKGRKHLSVPISLSYHASGIKVGEIPGWVGLGWALNAGGVITRTVRGRPDDSPFGYYNTHSQTDSEWDNLPYFSTDYGNHFMNGEVDPEPDQFFYNFAGQSGKFVIGQESGKHNIRTVPHTKLKFEFTRGTRPISIGIVDGVVSWKVTDESGTKYIFEDIEWSFDGLYCGCGHASSWYLTKIVSADEKEEITFKYSKPSPLIVYEEPYYFEALSNTNNSCRYGDGTDVKLNLSERYLIWLTTITSPQGTVEFETSSGRKDFPQEQKLDAITIRSASAKDKIAKRFFFTYDYFEGDRRLRLDKVTEESSDGASSLPPYEFTYDSSYVLPHRLSQAIDHWGFYNGQETNRNPLPSLIFKNPWTGRHDYYPGNDREPHADFLLAGTLTDIKYPTGGTTHFDYEPHRYGHIGIRAVTGAPKEKPAQTVTRPYFTTGYTTASFVVAGVGLEAVPVWVSSTFTLVPANRPNICSQSRPCLEVRIEKADGSVAYKNNERSTSDVTVWLAPGEYKLLAATNGSYDECINCQIEARMRSWQDMVPATERMAGGLRVRQIIDSDGLNQNPDRIRVFAYLDKAGTKSSGVLVNEPLYHFAKTLGICQYLSRSSMAVVGPGMTRGSHIGYERVVVKHGDGSATPPGGWTEHIFTAPNQPPTDIPDRPDGRWPFAPVTSYEYFRGFEKETSTYNSASKLQRQTANARFDAEEEAKPDPKVSHHYKAISIKVAVPLRTSNDLEVFVNGYEVISSWLHPVSETVTIYDQSGANPISSTRSFEHGNRDHLQLTKTTETNSDGSQRITETVYANELNGYAGMKNKNMLTQVYSTTIKSGASDVESKQWTTYEELGGFWRPEATWAWVGDGSANDTTAPPEPKEGDAETIRVTDFVSYDNYWRVQEQNDARGTTTTLSYGGTNDAFLTGVSRGNLSTTYAHHPVYNRVSQITKNGFTTFYDYDAYGRLERIRNQNGASSETLSEFKYTYGLPSSVETVTYLTETPIKKTTTSIEYVDGLGRPIQRAFENGDKDVIAAMEYDRFGRVAKTFKPYFSGTANYDPEYVAHAIAAYPNGGIRPYVETTYLADPLNRVDKTLGEGDYRFGVNRDYFNDAGNGLTYVLTVDEEGKRKHTYTDKFGNAVRTVAGIASTRFAYDVLGKRTQVTDPLNLVTTYQYDPLGRLLEKKSFDSGTVRHKYDKNGNLRFSQDAQQDDPSKPAGEHKLSFTLYDLHNRPVASGEAFADFSSADPNTVNAFEGESTWLSVSQYDTKPLSSAFPWRLFVPHIDVVSMSQLKGRLAATAQKSGGAWQVALYSYSPDGFVLNKYVFSQGLDATRTIFAYTRDRQGNPTTIQTRVGVQYAGPVQGLIGGNSFFHFYDYDARGLLEKVSTNTTNSKPAVADVTYGDFTPGGLKGNVQFLGGTTIPYTYTIRDWVETIDNLGTPAASFGARYVYNRNGTLWTAEFNQANSPSASKQYKYTFGYDGLNHLTSADYDGGDSFDESIQYYVNGNIKALTRWNEKGSTIDQLTFNYKSGSNRLDSVTDAIPTTTESWDAETGSFGYDLNGSMTSAGAPYNVSNILYDARHLPEQMTRGTTTISYRYGADGQRYYKKVGTKVAEHHVMDGNVTMAVFDANGNLKHWNIVGNGVLGRREPSGTTTIPFFYVQDHLGSTRAVVKSTIDGGTGQVVNEVVETSDYYPFGLAMPGRGKVAATPTREKFTGKERDQETDLDYFGARYYMPALGRWMAVDPMADQYPGVTPYNYVLNNPTILVDPNGLLVQKPCDEDDDPRRCTVLEEVTTEGQRYATWEELNDAINSGEISWAEGLRYAAEHGFLGDPKIQKQMDEVYEWVVFKPIEATLSAVSAAELLAVGAFAVADAAGAWAVKKIGVKIAKDGTHLWTNGLRDVAMAKAKDAGGKTLESTFLGRVMEFMWNSGFMSQSAKKEMAGMASRKVAGQATGQVTVHAGLFNPNNAIRTGSFLAEELRILMTKTDVTLIFK